MAQKTKNRIYTDRGTGVKLAEVFGCTTVTVCNALVGKLNSKLSEKIRHTAIKEYGGVEIQTNK